MKVGLRDIPTCDENEVLVKVEYAGVNRAETLQRKGLDPPPKGATDILGLECAGRIVLKQQPDEVLSDR